MHQARSLLFVLLLVVLTGCEGARPIEDVSIPENPPDFSIPDSTLATLVRAIHDRSTTNFGLVFADTVLEAHEFHAVFDSIDIIEWHSAGHPTYPQDWRSMNAFEIERWCMRATRVPPAPARRAED